MPNRKPSIVLSADISKFILSIMVVAIHVSPVSPNLRTYLLPLLRIAVPLFFMISSYFLFLKLSRAEDGKRVLINYITRTVKLYLFWYIVLFVPTLIYRSDTYQAWFAEGVVPGLLHYILSILFSSTFKVSWYLSASIVGAVGLYYLDKVNHTLSLFISIIFYITACLSSNYYGIVPALVQRFILMLDVLGQPYNSFPVAFLWMLIGKRTAEWFSQHDPSSTSLGEKRGVLCVLAVLGVIILYIERAAIARAGIARADDCYFSLLPIAIPLFLLVLSFSASDRYQEIARFLRSASTITYCLHATLAFMLTYVGIINNERFLFYVTLPLCWGLTVCVMLLEKKPHLSFLRFSH